MNVVPIIAADHASALAGVPFSRTLVDGEALAMSLLAAYERYDPDLVVVFVDVNLEAEAVGAGVAFPDDDYPHVAHPVAPDRADWSFDPNRARLSVMRHAVTACKKALPADVPVAASIKGPFSMTALALGTERFLAMLYEQPELARDALSKAARFQGEHARSLAALGAVPWFGDPFASADLLGPTWFREFARDPLRTVVSEAQKSAGAAAVHICGNPDDLVRECDPVAPSWLSVELTDPARFRKESSVPLLLGGMPTHALLHDPPEAIEAFCRDRARSWPDGCVFATDCDVPRHAPPGSVDAMMRGARAGFELGGRS